MVELEGLEDVAERREVRALIERHREHTGSEVAGRLLADWDAAAEDFVKVLPTDYKRVLRARAEGGCGSPEGGCGSPEGEPGEPVADRAVVAAAT